MISFPLVNGHDDESRASTQARQATVTSLDPETLSYDNALREAHNTLLELPSTSQTHIRYSVTSFNEQLDEISADEEFLYRSSRTPQISADEESSNERTQNQLNDPGDDNLRSELRIPPDSTHNLTPAPDQLRTRPSNEPPSATLSPEQPNFDPNSHLTTSPPLTANPLPPTTEPPQNHPALADLQPSSLFAVTARVHTSHPTPAQPSSPNRNSSTSKPGRHRRRFVCWIKKKFRKQLPWSANSLHNEREVQRALRRVESQGLS